MSDDGMKTDAQPTPAAGQVPVQIARWRQVVGEALLGGPVALIIPITLAVLLILFPILDNDQYWVRELSLIAVLALVVSGVNLSFGYAGEIQFGQMRVQTPADLGPDRTTAFTATERILLAQGDLYACGRWNAGAIGKPPWAPLILSQSGRIALLGAARRRALRLVVAGAVLTSGSILVFLLR